MATMKSKYQAIYVDVAPAATAESVGAIVAELMPDDYRAWSIDEDDFVAGSYVIVDLVNLPEGTWLPLAEKVRDAIRDRLGVGSRLESEIELADQQV